MYKDIRENIQAREIEYTYLALMSDKLRIGIIGGGEAGFIKAKNFIKKGCYVEILSKKFSEKFINIENNNIVLNRKAYNKGFISDKHIIILSLNDEKLRKEIISHCEEEFKIFIDCSNFKEGMAVVPVQRETTNISFALNTKVGNPKGAVLVAEAAMKTLRDYNGFIEYTGLIRNKAKNLNYCKKEIIDFISTEDFKFIWEKNRGKIVLRMFFEEAIIRELDI